MLCENVCFQNRSFFNTTGVITNIVGQTKQNMDNTEIIAFHSSNVSNLNDIIDSIKEYLDEIHNSPRFLNETNRSESVKQWLDIFITCRTNLINEKVKIESAFQKGKMRMLNFDSKYQEFIAFLKDFPQTISNQEIYTNSILPVDSRELSKSNINPFEIFKLRAEGSDRIIIDCMQEIESATLNYNSWLDRVEKSLYLKHTDITPFEALIRTLMFQDNSLAKQLHKGIKNNTFQKLEVLPKLPENTLKIK